MVEQPTLNRQAEGSTPSVPITKGETVRKRDRRALLAYVRRCADVMELRDWEIALSRDTADPGVAAQILWSNARRYATLTVEADFRSQPLSDVRETIAHELMHLHYAASWDMVLHDLDELLGKPAQRVFWQAWKRTTEYAIEASSLAVAKHLPLIDWP